MAHKTSTELQAELLVLKQELASVSALAAGAVQAQRRLTDATASHLLGHSSASDLQTAHAALSAATEALPRVALLREVVAKAEAELDYTIGQERSAFCQSVRDEYSATFAAYTEQSKALLATFKTLNTLHNKHAALTGRPLMEPNQSLLCLPVCHRNSEDTRNFPTGVQVMSGALK